MRSITFAFVAALASVASAQIAPSTSTGATTTNSTSSGGIVDAGTILTLISTAISNLPACTTPCLQKVPNFSTTLTGAFVDSFCRNLTSTSTTTVGTLLRDCAAQQCATADRSAAVSFLSNLPSLCTRLPANMATTTTTVQLVLPSNSTSASVAATTTSPVKNAAAGGMVGGWVAAAAVGVAALFA
ncbi:hypothetical protein HDU96_008493 [Phlyctochytrium bullatum]|nr:hypothetical protein HDU96_008493 [Phlyctochytrium bullatum]